jgi:hypothetical protein
MNAKPSPLMMPQHRPVQVATNIAAEVDVTAPGRVVRPGVVEVVSAHDGVIKAKQLAPGMKVRSWLHGKACGSEKVVSKVTRVEDGTMIEVEFSSGHPTSRFKPAYRFFVAALQGTEVVTRKRALVEAY